MKENREREISLQFQFILCPWIIISKRLLQALTDCILCFHESFSFSTGVHRTDIDLKQQMVTVTGSVKAETLISRLEKKTHKRPILLLPDKATSTSKAATKEKKQSKPKPIENTNNNSDNNRNVEGEAEKEDNKAEKKTECRQPDAAAEPVGKSRPGKNGTRESMGAEDRKEAKEEKQPEEAKQERQPVEVKQSASVTVPDGEQSPVPEKPAAEKVGDSEESGTGTATATASGNGSKKKKPRGQNGNNGKIKEGKMGKEVSTGGMPMNSDQSPDPSPSQDQGSSRDEGLVEDPVNHILHHQRLGASPYMNHPYAPHYYHEPPTYAVRYNTVHPMGSYGASYYAAQPPPTSYAYTHLGQDSEPAPPYSDPYAVQRSDSFELFSDENPNACSIM